LRSSWHEASVCKPTLPKNSLDLMANFMCLQAHPITGSFSRSAVNNREKPSLNAWYDRFTHWSKSLHYVLTQSLRTAAQRLGGHCHFWVSQGLLGLHRGHYRESTSLTFGSQRVLGTSFLRGWIGHAVGVNADWVVRMWRTLHTVPGRLPGTPRYTANTQAVS
jgi:hypothetical protein